MDSPSAPPPQPEPLGLAELAAAAGAAAGAGSEAGGGAGRPFGRRLFLALMGLTAAGVLWGSRAQSLVERLAPGNVGGLLSILPVGRFRIYSVTKTLPQRSPEEYRLRVTGLVDRPLDLSYAELLALPPTGLTRDFQCVTGWRVKDVSWKGVVLSQLLDAAGADPAAAGCRFISFDGTYTESLTMTQARRDDVLVAYEMEGKPVSRAHGGPARLYVAPMYGYKSCKWLEEITVVADPIQIGYWEELGYDVDGWVGSSNGRDDRPT